MAVNHGFLCGLLFANPLLNLAHRQMTRALDAAELPFLQLAHVEQQGGRILCQHLPQFLHSNGCNSRHSQSLLVDSINRRWHTWGGAVAKDAPRSSLVLPTFFATCAGLF